MMHHSWQFASFGLVLFWVILTPGDCLNCLEDLPCRDCHLFDLIPSSATFLPTNGLVDQSMVMTLFSDAETDLEEGVNAASDASDAEEGQAVELDYRQFSFKFQQVGELVAVYYEDDFFIGVLCGLALFLFISARHVSYSRVLIVFCLWVKVRGLGYGMGDRGS
ncbi:hypothetical protein ACOMHN_064125 [Nucella lapillus]